MTHSCFISLWSDAVVCRIVVAHSLSSTPFSVIFPSLESLEQYVCDSIESQHAMHTTKQTYSFLAILYNKYTCCRARSVRYGIAYTRYDSTEQPQHQGNGNRHCHACASTWDNKVNRQQYTTHGEGKKRNPRILRRCCRWLEWNRMRASCASVHK